jgi:hypothetical protein
LRKVQLGGRARTCTHTHTNICTGTRTSTHTHTSTQAFNARMCPHTRVEMCICIAMTQAASSGHVRNEDANTTRN